MLPQIKPTSISTMEVGAKPREVNERARRSVKQIFSMDIDTPLDSENNNPQKSGAKNRVIKHKPGLILRKAQMNTNSRLIAEFSDNRREQHREKIQEDYRLCRPLVKADSKESTNYLSLDPLKIGPRFQPYVQTDLAVLETSLSDQTPHKKRRHLASFHFSTPRQHKKNCRATSCYSHKSGRRDDTQSDILSDDKPDCGKQNGVSLNHSSSTLTPSQISFFANEIPASIDKNYCRDLKDSLRVQEEIMDSYTATSEKSRGDAYAKDKFIACNYTPSSELSKEPRLIVSPSLPPDAVSPKEISSHYSSSSSVSSPSTDSRDNNLSNSLAYIESPLGTNSSSSFPNSKANDANEICNQSKITASKDESGNFFAKRKERVRRRSFLGRMWKQLVRRARRNGYEGRPENSLGNEHSSNDVSTCNNDKAKEAHTANARENSSSPLRGRRTSSAPSLLKFVAPLTPSASGTHSGAKFQGGTNSTSLVLARSQDDSLVGVRNKAPGPSTPAGSHPSSKMVPLHELRSLHRRSEIMEHNITVGLKALSYLQNGCGLSPKRASEFVRPILLLEDCCVDVNDTFTPLKNLALKAYGRQAFTGRRLTRKMLQIEDKSSKKRMEKQKTKNLGNKSNIPHPPPDPV